jgi:hypothetical protein
MNEAHCKHCRYFLLTREEQNTGICRRYAPKPIFLHQSKRDIPAVTRWPDVGPEDWCGEFDPVAMEHG